MRRGGAPSAEVVLIRGQTEAGAAISAGRKLRLSKSAVRNANEVTNIVIAGLGGQGVLKASDIVAEVVFRAGFDVKKSEIHGMSQRGGSVSSDVRFGERVYSPMVPLGEAIIWWFYRPIRWNPIAGNCGRRYVDHA